MRRFFPCENEKPNETKVAITQAGGGHAAADQVPVCWSLAFNWTPFYIRIHIYIHIWLCTLSSDLRKIRLAPELPERNYCVSRGVFIYTWPNMDVIKICNFISKKKNLFAYWIYNEINENNSWLMYLKYLQLMALWTIKWIHIELRRCESFKCYKLWIHNDFTWCGTLKC